MEYKKLDERAVKSWRIGRIIALGIVLAVVIPISVLLQLSSWESIWKTIIICANGADRYLHGGGNSDISQTGVSAVGIYY